MLGLNCGRLTPIVALIGDLYVYHNVNRTPQSCHHVLGYVNLAPRLSPDKFFRLQIHHTTEPSLNWRTRTPHWGISTTFPSFVTPYKSLYLEKLHFRSLRDIVLLIRQLTRVEDAILKSLT